LHARAVSFWHGRRRGVVRGDSTGTIGSRRFQCQSAAPRQQAKRAAVLLATALCFTAGAISGCSSHPSERTTQLASTAGAIREIVPGAGFEHVVFSRYVDARSSALHIYFDSDGTPLIHARQVSRDPTPREPLALQLMLVDPLPSAYIGRPCYEGLAAAPGCTPLLWTLQRYSETVVASMTAAVEALLARSPAAEVTMIGYSGGGVLALLVAQRLTRVVTVVTIAANLDIDAWTTLHGYSALAGSINPAAQTQWRVALRQIHFAGGRDQNVPAAMTRGFAGGVPNAQVRIIETYDHRCCWLEQWPTLLDTLAESP
jgi:hypothetical protein